MTKNPASLAKHVLAEELSRIRSTYSFQLGLLITESFVRKPWKIFAFLLIYCS